MVLLRIEASTLSVSSDGMIGSVLIVLITTDELFRLFKQAVRGLLIFLGIKLYPCKLSESSEFL